MPWLSDMRIFYRGILPLALISLSCTGQIAAPAQEIVAPGTATVSAPDPNLVNAVRRGDVEAVKPFLAADPELLRKKLAGGASLLFYALNSPTLRGEIYTAMVEFLLKSGADPNMSGPHLVHTPLVMAVGARDLTLVRLLLEHKADPNLPDMDGQSPVHHAYVTRQPEILRALIAAGGSVNQWNNRGYTALHLAAAEPAGDIAVLEMMLKEGGDPLLETRSGLVSGSPVGFRQGLNALHVAAAAGNVAAVRLLLKQTGVRVNSTTAVRESALHLAASQGLAAIPVLLEAGADPNLKNRNGDNALLTVLRPPGISETTPLSTAARDAALSALIKQTDVAIRGQLGLTPLQLALQARDRATVQQLLDRSPATSVQEQIFLAAAQNDTRTLKRLLQARPHLAEAPTANGWTPLHVAALWHSDACAQLLLEAGVNVNARDGARATPLTRLLQQPKTTPELLAMAQLLLSHKADANVVADAGLPLHRAIWLGSTELAQLLIKYGAKLEKRNSNTETALLAATRGASSGMVPYLLEMGARVNAVNGINMSAVDLAAMNSDIKTMELLLANGADANGGDSDGGMAPLWRAVKSANLEMTRLLLAHKANPNVRTSFGESVLAAARRHGSPQILQLVTAAGAMD